MRASGNAVIRAKQKLKEREEVSMCLRARVCPRCASDLEESKASFGEEKLMCVKCSFEIPTRNTWVS